MADALVSVRAVHFASTVLLAGSLLFWSVILAPALAQARSLPGWSARLQRQLQVLNWLSLAVAIGSGLSWLLLVVGQIADVGWQSTLGNDMLLAVIQQTQLGQVFVLRAALAGVLAVLLLWQSAAWPRAIATVVALALLGAMAWTGHAGAAVERSGLVHLVVDISHLLVAGAWFGGLLPLWLLIGHAHRACASGSISIASASLHRFSLLGLVSVFVLLASGTANSWFLVGGLSGLTDTTYGHWLIVKLLLFVCMLCLAAINRMLLLTRLDTGDATEALAQYQALARLRASTLGELGLAVAILLIVAMLGTLAPAAHHHN